MVSMHWRRVSFALASLTMLVAGLGATFWGGTSGSANNEYVIEVDEQGFNPPLCHVKNGEDVRWKNIGDKPHRVYYAVHETWDPHLDTGYIEPGELSRPVRLTLNTIKWEYWDYDNPENRGLLVTVINQPSVCAPWTPTPTPTPTPTATPTPIPTATPDPRTSTVINVAREQE
ncbi:MAG: hypothetical protein Kow0010_17130 [Dehalococcoidia bacterium]